MLLSFLKFLIIFVSIYLLQACSQTVVTGRGGGIAISQEPERLPDSIPLNAPNNPALQLYPTEFTELSGWSVDNHAEAVMAFRQSCKRWQGIPATRSLLGAFTLGTVADWTKLCDLNISQGEEKTFFEKNFKPYLVVNNGSAVGLFTGYYLPELHGSLTKTERYNIPIYRKPDDLMEVDKKTGRMVNGQFVPYHDRAAIYDGALADKGLELVWVDDLVEAYFMEVQGSGRIIMEDGTMKAVGFDAKNGRGYFAIGKALVESGVLAKEGVSMKTIRTWIQQHPDEGLELLKKNASYVFFRFTSIETGPIGAMGLPLTSQRSLAVDREYLPLGIPLWLDAEHPAGDQRLRRLMLAQDTGGAIKGAIRGDFYWGQGTQAGEIAGNMKSRGYYYLLLPRSLSFEKNTVASP